MVPPPFPAIAFVEREDRGLLVVFLDGRHALYTAALLYDMLFLAAGLTIPARTGPKEFPQAAAEDMNAV